MLLCSVHPGAARIWGCLRGRKFGPYTPFSSAQPKMNGTDLRSLASAVRRKDSRREKFTIASSVESVIIILS